MAQDYQEIVGQEETRVNQEMMEEMDLQDHEVLMDRGDPSALLVHLDGP